MSEFELQYYGEIRFGPSYFRLFINGNELIDRIFGQLHCISANERYVAFEEWLTTNYSDGPITRVVIYDLLKNHISELSDGQSGFIELMEFTETSFRYSRHNYGQKIIDNFEVTFASMSFKD